MSAAVFAIVLGAAALHAFWNALVKAAGDRVATLGLISLGHVVLGCVLALAAPLPAVASWPFIVASTVIHFAYYWLLNRSYRLGDLSLAYPVARGIAPVLVTLAATLAAGEWLAPAALLGVALVSAGVIGLAHRSRNAESAPGAVTTALATGLTIAAYSVVDGLGVRASGAPLGYIGWLFIFEIFVAGFIIRLRRGRILASRRGFLTGLSGGLISAGAYGLVIYAKTLAPLGLVSTLRETSVVFATLIGVVILGERPWRRRLLASLIVVSGVVAIAVA